MTERAKLLNELIDKLSGVCADGREGIRNLVSEITREKLAEPKDTYRIGDRFSFIGNEYILAVADSGTNPMVVAVNLRTGSRRGVVGTVVRSLYEITEDELRLIFRTGQRRSVLKIGDAITRGR